MHGSSPEVYIKHAIWLAHRLLGDMFHHYPEEFSRTSGQSTNPRAVREFWAGAAVTADPRLVNHPLLQKPNYQNMCVPIGIHADGVPFKKADPGSSLKVRVARSMPYGGRDRRACLVCPCCACRGRLACSRTTIPDPHSKRRVATLQVTSWFSLLGEGESTIDTHFLWDAVPSGFACKQKQHGCDTDDVRMKVKAPQNATHLTYLRLE